MPRKTAAWYAKHPNSKYWKTKGDKIWSELIRKAWDGCAVCSRPNTQAHHILTKGAYPQYRHELINGIPLCYMHHTAQKQGQISAHGSPRMFDDWLQKHYIEKWNWVQLARKTGECRTKTWKELYEFLLECARFDNE